MQRANTSPISSLLGSSGIGTGQPIGAPYNPYAGGGLSSYGLGSGNAMMYAGAGLGPAPLPPPSAYSGLTPGTQTFNIPPTTGITNLPTSTPLAPEAQVRLRYVELQVSGVNTDGDRSRLEQTLNKLKEVRGVTIKARLNGSSVAKVWYSEKDPVQVDGLIQVVTNLGFGAVAN
jgi:hypothetical protein